MSKSKFNFEHVPMPRYPRSLFDISQGHDTTISGGYIYPLYHEEVLPGDTFQMDARLFARMATPIKPFLTNVYMNVQFYYVPNRLVFDKFVNMMGERSNPDDSIDYQLPTITVPSGGFAVGSIFDYLGYPVGVEPYIDSDTTEGAWSALPLRAYNLIYNEFYRDQNLIDSVPFSDGVGPDSASDYTLLRRGKRKDYFTGAYPEPQKGQAPEIGIGGVLPVTGNGYNLGVTNGTKFAGTFAFSNTGAIMFDETLYGKAQGTAHGTGYGLNSSVGVPTLEQLDDHPEYSGLQVDLSATSPININQLRLAFQIQRYLEREMLGGSRYVEWLRSQFGVISPDFRNYRPEFLGGATYRLNVNPVVQTSNASGQTTPQGNLSAFALVSGSNRWTKTFTEHGQILGLVCIYADKYYCQGIHRKFTRRGRFDFALPVLAHVGMQGIKNREIYVSGTSTDNEPFGYTYVYDEYRIGYNRVSGLMRASVPNNVSSWTIQENYSETPTLNEDFINENPPFSNVVAVPSEPEFYFDGYFHCKVARELPVYGFPGLIDHG